MSEAAADPEPSAQADPQAILQLLRSQLADRTAELRTTQEELQKTNSDLLQLTLELEDRVTERTQDFVEANRSLRQEMDRRQAAEAALRDAHERLELAVTSSQTGLWDWEVQTDALFLSDICKRQLGYGAHDRLDRFEAWEGHLHPEDRDRVVAALRACLAKPGGRIAIEYRVRRTDGAERWMFTQGAVIPDEQGQAHRMLGSHLDITARKHLEQEIQTLNVELRDRIQQLRALASELTLAEQRERLRLAELIHDGLQQLLVAARFRVTQVGRGEDPTVGQECQEIGQLLDEALVDSRSLTAELSPPILRTGGLLAGLEWLARWSQEKHHLTVQVTAPTEPHPPLPEDLTVLLFQSVRELLFNAVKYAQVPEAAVTLAWDPPGLTLTVADAGAGFAPSSLRGEGGVAGGFGLARIRHRLELLGGCMNIDSAPGQGTRVTLAVLLPTADQPAAPPSGSGSEPTPSPQRAVALEAESLRKTRILIVDDHQVVRRALAQLLGVEADLAVVGEASTGTAAVALARQLAPDVVLMDINIPEMNGIEATRAIHTAFPAMRVIGLSMFDRGEQQAAMQEAGAVAYVSKSAPAEELFAAIRASTGRTA